MSEIDKQLVARRFAKAAGTYTEAAVVQQHIARKMAGLLEQFLPRPSTRRVVEIGCGTGIYSRLLQVAFQPELLLLNDLCPEMESYCSDIRREGVRFVPGDAECIELPTRTDLITSCSTLQWLEHPETFFARCSDALREEGCLAFSTFGTENMREIRRLTGKGLTYRTRAELEVMLTPYYDLVYAEEEVIAQPFGTAWEVLRHLQQTGVNGTEGHRWGSNGLRRFLEEYARLFGSANEVPLTYHPMYIIAQKKKEV